MKTEKDIKSEEYGKLFVPDSNFSVSNMVAAFSSGYTQAQKDLLAEVSEGFEEWWNNQDSISYPSSLERCWQAARLPLMKKIEELELQYSFRGEVMDSNAERYADVCKELSKLQKENEELREALDFIGNILEGDSYILIGRALEEWYEEIHTRFSLDKNDKGAV